MPNLTKLLNEEISRLARKEVRAICSPLQDQVRDLKKTVRDQRDQIVQLQKQIQQLQAVAPDPTEVILEAKDIDETKIRLSPDSIKKHRKRLGITQAELGQLLNVSMQTIIRWEQGKSKPKETQKAGIAQLRTMGVREVKKLLAIDRD